MEQILKYLNSLQSNDHIDNVFIKVKSTKDIDVLVITDSPEYVTPIRATIEANFYVNRNLAVRSVRSLSNSELIALTGEDNTLRIKVIESKRFDSSKVRDILEYIE